MFEGLIILAQAAENLSPLDKSIVDSHGRTLTTHLKVNMSPLPIDLNETSNESFFSEIITKSSAIHSYIDRVIFMCDVHKWKLLDYKIFQYRNHSNVHWSSGKFRRVLVHFGGEQTYSIGRSIKRCNSGDIIVAGAGTIKALDINEDVNTVLLLTFSNR